MTLINILIRLTIGIALFGPALCYADERIWLEGAMINGKPAKLCFDTEANVNAIMPQAVKRLELRVNTTIVTNDISPGFSAGVTDHCTLTLNGIQIPTAFVVVNLPDYVNTELDGLIGWWFSSQNVVKIDASAGKVDFFSKIPKRAANWIQLSVITNFDTLDLEVPKSGDHTNSIISIDTGNDGGVEFPPREWHRWKEAHPQSPITLKIFYTPADGFAVCEEAWADQVRIGPLVLTGVPVIEESPSAVARWGGKSVWTLGLAALKRLNLVVDGKNSVAYLQSKTAAPAAYAHNRLGAVFVATATHTNEAIAVVVTGSPAYEAGVRNGDILLKVNKIHVIGWTADWNSCFEMPSGTKLYLTLQRDGKVFAAVATLRQIIAPDAAEH